MSQSAYNEASSQSRSQTIANGGSEKGQLQNEDAVASPRKMINVLLAAALTASCYLDYWQYSIAFHRDPYGYLAVVHGVADAPAQYRIGVIDSAYFLARHGHTTLIIVFTLIDLLTGLAAAFTLLSLLRGSSIYKNSTAVGRWVGEIAFVGLVEYYFAWLTWYQRPETLTTAVLLVFTLALLTRPPRLKGSLGYLLTATGLLLVTALQSLVRADIAFALNLGVLLICLVRRNATFSLPRALQAAVSSIGVLLAVGIQLFLMREVFPHAGYGSTKVVQIVHNLKNVAGWPPFFLFMLPVFWTLWRILKKKSHITDPDAALALGACIFACMWSIVGIVQEVRIFFPYALVLAPLTICLLMQATLSKPTVRSN